MGFFDKLKQGLFKTKNAIVGKIDSLIKRFTKVDEELFDELEELLISADIGVNTTEEILDELRDTVKDKKLKEPEEVKNELFEILRGMIGEHEPLNLSTKPSVILVIGVNGVGKTTAIGKIAAELKSQHKKVVVAAADTFRAAAAEQLTVWCERAGVDIIKQAAGADPASVVFDAINAVKSRGADVLIIDSGVFSDVCHSCAPAENFIAGLVAAHFCRVVGDMHNMLLQSPERRIAAYLCSTSAHHLTPLP